MRAHSYRDAIESYRGVIEMEESRLDPSPVGLYNAAIPIACLAGLGVWVLAIWKLVELL
jgi:hypothetical protein